MCARPLVLAWAGVNEATGMPCHYVALQRTSNDAASVHLPASVRPRVWPWVADIQCGDAVEWSLGASVDVGTLSAGSLNFASFACGSAYGSLLQTLQEFAVSELLSLGGGAATSSALRAPPGSALVATDALLRLFYDTCGVQAAARAAAAAALEMRAALLVDSVGADMVAAVNAVVAGALDSSNASSDDFAPRLAAAFQVVLEQAGAARGAVGARMWLLAREKHGAAARVARECGAAGDEAAESATAELAMSCAATFAPPDAAWEAHNAAAAERALARTDSSDGAPPAPLHVINSV